MASVLAAYWTQTTQAEIPPVGATLFPAKKKVGLDLTWIRGRNGLPVSLMPSAFDTQPTVRERIGVQKVMTEMPFFREAMIISERDRQELLKAEQLGPDYVKQVIGPIYDDAMNLIKGAMVPQERMRMSLLADGTISIVPPAEKGVNVSYSYNYDPTGEWAASNKVTLIGSDTWDNPDSSNPITDILNAKRRASRKYGVTLARGIMSTKTWDNLMKSKSIRMDMNVSFGDKIILTDSMLEAYLFEKVGMRFYINDAQYYDEGGIAHAYFPDGVVSMFPNGVLGSTWFGTTPEEADLAARQDIDVKIVETGIAISSEITTRPTNIITWASEIVLPSFEQMDAVQVLKVF